MASPSSSEETSPALVGAQFLFRCIELGRCQFLRARLVRYYALLDLLVVSADAKNLPGAHHAVVQGVDDMKHVATSKTHFPLLGLLVMEMRPEQI